MNEKSTAKLTQEDIDRAFKWLNESDSITVDTPYWIDNENFYLGDIADRLGFKCTPEELLAAKKHEHNFIKNVHGVELYLSRVLNPNYEDKKLRDIYNLRIYGRNDN